MSLIDWLRDRRDRSRALCKFHTVLRGPYYSILELLFPRGIMISLSSEDRFRIHPVFKGMAIDKYETELMTIFRRHLSLGMLVIDIGAHVGFYSMVASRRVGVRGKVIAIEASPSNVAMLTTHLGANDCANVEIVAAAAGDQRSTLDFAYCPDPLDPAAFANSIVYDISDIRTRISMITVDDICSELAPNLIKIDVEGAELMVLKGASRTLEKHAPLVLVAIHPEALAGLGQKPRDLVEYMHDRGYSVLALDGSPTADPGLEEVICAPNARMVGQRSSSALSSSTCL